MRIVNESARKDTFGNSEFIFFETLHSPSANQCFVRSSSQLPAVQMSVESQENELLNVDAEMLKEQGNASFRAGDFVTALQLYTQAIDLDPSNAKYLINRSLCFASMNDWSKSGEDARASIKLAPKATKAHFRLVKSLFELGKFKDARLAILNGLKECGEGKEMKLLEDELLTRTGIPLRPKSTDFEIVGELGDGNFSKVYKALHKSTNKVFAIKVSHVRL